MRSHIACDGAFRGLASPVSLFIGGFNSEGSLGGVYDSEIPHALRTQGGAAM